MKFTGRDHVVQYSAKDEGRQIPGTDGYWNDSTWLQWWDFETHCGGVHRIGHEYNYEGGPFAAGWTNLVTPLGIYKNVNYLPLREQDKLANGWGDGEGIVRQEIVGDEHRWIIENPKDGVSAYLVFKDFHGTFCGFPSAGATSEHISAHHIDVSGTVTGTITMGGKTFKVNGMGLRDHGWGRRDVNKILSHRYTTGCWGPDLSYCAYAVCNGVSDTVESFGWVVKGDTVHFARDIDIVAYAESDSASIRGGHVRLTLPDGEVLEIEQTAVAPGLMSYFHKMYNNNTLCVATVNGRKGAGHLETSMNFYSGSRIPGKMIRALAHNGFYPGANVDRASAAGVNPFMQINII